VDGKKRLVNPGPRKGIKFFQIMITRKEKEEKGFAICHLHNSLEGRD
jgi:hypothetical protein